MSTFNIKQNDTSPAILYALTPTDVSLAGATVKYRMRPIGATSWLIDASADVVTETGTPTVRYNWQATDTQTPGFYEAEFVVTYFDATIETFPNSGFITIDITGDETGTSEQINQVRFLIGDTDSSDYGISNENIVFALAQTSSIYAAAAMCARALAAKYASEVDTKFESVSVDYSQKAKAYYDLAKRLERQAKAQGGLGVPLAGGLTISDRDAVNADTDRIKPKFYTDQFDNPGGDYDEIA